MPFRLQSARAFVTTACAFVAAGILAPATAQACKEACGVSFILHEDELMYDYARASGDAVTPIWPLAGTTNLNADTVEEPYGPRWISRYDFHAGLDLDASLNQPVKAVLPGTVVRVTTWDGTSTGAGNNILVNHGNGQFTAYLHLNTMNVTAGQVVTQGQVIGGAGKTGASGVHLHLTYMVGLTGTSNDERKSRNPLEILPHTEITSLSPATLLDADTVRIRPSLQNSTIKSITLAGENQSRTIDYYTIVAQGSTARDTQLQNGIYIETANPSGGTFPLDLSLTLFKIESILVKDFNGLTLLDQQFEDTWRINGNGEWANTANWTTFRSPDRATAKVRLGTAITSARTISLNSSVMLDRLVFENNNRYTIAGTGELNFVGGTAAGLQVVNGSHLIALDGGIKLSKNLTADIAGGATLTVQSKIASVTAGALSFTKAGNGTLNARDIDVNALNVNAGRLALESGNRLILARSFSMAAGATLDLADGTLAIDYAPAAPSPLATVRALIESGRHGGDWAGTGITSSMLDPSMAIGYGAIGALAAGVVPQITDGSAVVVRVTKKGDVDLNGVVNFDDLLRIAQAYGTEAGMSWVNGDSNYDGAVNFDDLLALAQNYQGSAGVLEGVSADFAADWALARSLVPEPASLGGLLLTGLLARRRR